MPSESAATHSEPGWAYGVVFTDLHNCGCGQFDERLALVRQILRDCPLYDNERWRTYSTPADEWVLCLLSDADLIEHGGSVGGSWITDKGKRFLAALEDEETWRLLTDCDAAIGYCECSDCGWIK